LQKEIAEPVIEGERHADVTLISWGSTRGSILEAMKQLRKQDMKVNFLQIQYLDPFPTKVVTEVMKRAKKIAIVENNKTGQLAALIKEKTGLDPHYKILKYDGRPFFTDELAGTIKEII
jgi:2-oxoglutarate/2-oxoacid ferredoxin oxidoreductase subunit alpha